MEITVTIPDKWKVMQVHEGNIYIQSEITSKEICRLEISDFDNVEHAMKIADAIASLPDMLRKEK